MKRKHSHMRKKRKLRRSRRSARKQRRRQEKIAKNLESLLDSSDVQTSTFETPEPQYAPYDFFKSDRWKKQRKNTVGPSIALPGKRFQEKNSLLYSGSKRLPSGSVIALPGRRRSLSQELSNEPIILSLSDDSSLSIPSDRQFYERQNSVLRHLHDAAIYEFLGLSYEVPIIGFKSAIENRLAKASSLLEKTIHLSTAAYEKTLDAARYASPDELYMHLLKSPDASQKFASDVMVAHDQEATPSFCRTGNLIKDVAYREEKGLTYFGWTHSHGLHSTFHSQMDYDNIAERLANAHTPEISFTGLFDMELKIKYLPSVVVNAAGDKPDGLIGVRFYSAVKEQFETKFFKAPIELVESDFIPDPLPRSVVENNLRRYSGYL